MEPVLLGLAAPTALNQAGNILERTLETVSKPFAEVLHAVSEAISQNTDKPSALESSDLNTRNKEFLAGLVASIQQTLSEAGIELTEPLELRVSAIDGRLEVVGDHPQRALIESALAEADTSLNDLKQLAGANVLIPADPWFDEAAWFMNQDELEEIADPEDSKGTSPLI